MRRGKLCPQLADSIPSGFTSAPISAMMGACPESICRLGRDWAVGEEQMTPLRIALLGFIPMAYGQLKGEACRSSAMQKAKRLCIVSCDLLAFG